MSTNYCKSLLFEGAKKRRDSRFTGTSTPRACPILYEHCTRVNAPRRDRKKTKQVEEKRVFYQHTAEKNRQNQWSVVTKIKMLESRAKGIHFCSSKGEMLLLSLLWLSKVHTWWMIHLAIGQAGLKQLQKKKKGFHQTVASENTSH